MDNTQKLPSILSFCTGYGGLEIGITRAIGKINVLAHVEIEAWAIANLVAKMETCAMVPAPLWTDLKTFPSQCFSGCVDIITGGYPCQPFSAAGQRRGAKDPRHLWPWIRKHIETIQPGFCFFENVEGHISLGLREVLSDLVTIGYRVETDSGEPTWGLFSAAECGAPHQRKRVFILAQHENFGRKRLPAWKNNKRGIRLDTGAEREKDGVAACGSGELDAAGLQRQKVREQQAARIKQSGCKLADPGNAELNRLPEPEERREDRAFGDTGISLADTDGQGPQRRRELGEQAAGRETLQIIGYDFAGCRFQRWPARPGEMQHEWEEPRVLGDTSQQLQYRGRDTDHGKRKVESCMGGAINGHSSRVDRLRLLGNGVVPATAEKAFLTLMNRIENPSRKRPHIEIQMDLFPD